MQLQSENLGDLTVELASQANYCTPVETLYANGMPLSLGLAWHLSKKSFNPKYISRQQPSFVQKKIQ